MLAKRLWTFLQGANFELEVLIFEGFVQDVFDDVLHNVGGQDGLQAIEDFFGVEHEGLVASVLRPLSQGVHHTKKATSTPLQVFLVEAGGSHAHHGVHAGRFYLSCFGVREKETVPGQYTLYHLSGLGHRRRLEYGQVGGGDDPERLYLMGVVPLRIISNNPEKFGEGSVVPGLHHRLLLALAFVSYDSLDPAPFAGGVYPPTLQGIRSHGETLAT